MSWSRRALLLGLVVSGCGFRPVHGPAGSLRRGDLAFRAPQDPNGFDLLAALESRFGVPQDPTGTIDITGVWARPEVVLHNDPQNTSVGAMIAGANWTLARGGKPVKTGQTEARVPYNRRGDRLFSDASLKAARGTAITTLAERMFEDIAALS